MEPKDLAFAAAHVLDDKKATDVVIADVSEVADITDFFVIATGTTNRHVDSLVDDVEDTLKLEGAEPIAIEGREECSWALIDYGPVIVHLFQPQARQFYRLEHLWANARYYDVVDGEIVERPRPEVAQAEGEAPAAAADGQPA